MILIIRFYLFDTISPLCAGNVMDTAWIKRSVEFYIHLYTITIGKSINSSFLPIYRLNRTDWALYPWLATNLEETQLWIQNLWMVVWGPCGTQCVPVLCIQFLWEVWMVLHKPSPLKSNRMCMLFGCSVLRYELLDHHTLKMMREFLAYIIFECFRY